MASSASAVSAKRERGSSTDSFDLEKSNKRKTQTPDPRYTSLLDIAPHLREDTVHRIYAYIEQNRENFLRQARESQNSVYIRPADSGVERAVQFAPDGRIYIHLNRENMGDIVIGEGGFKLVKLAFEVNAARVYASAGFKAPDFQDEIANTLLLQGIPGFVQIAATTSYPFSVSQRERENEI